jgi:Flp pilus assembly protein TadG
MPFRNDERGQVLIITALCMVALMGFLALGVEVGVLFNTKRQMQIAADAGATAAALEYLHNGYDKSSAIVAGADAANANDVSYGPALTATISVNANANSPAVHKSCSGSTCYFEAIVTKQNPTIFYRAFFSLWTGSSGSGFTVAARAVAGTPGVSQNCIYLTAPSGTALTVQGKWSISAPNCGVYFNSASGSVEDDTGKAAKAGIDAASVEVVGSAPNNITIASGSSAVVTHVVPQSIPFSGINAPTPTGCVAKSSLTGSVSPGCYSGNLTIGTATLAAGLYMFTGNVTINGALTGTGVTLDINSGSLTVKPGNSSMNITAPLDGTYNGVLIYQPVTNTNTLSLEAGSSSGTFSGFIYAPGATLHMQDNGGGLSLDGLVVNAIDNGPAALTINGYSSSTSPLKVVSLVE